MDGWMDSWIYGWMMCLSTRRAFAPSFFSRALVCVCAGDRFVLGGKLGVFEVG
jgi:hypothetical protein